MSDTVSPETPLRSNVESLFNANTIDNHLQCLRKTPITPQAVINNHLMRSEDRIDKLELSILEIVEAQSKQYEAWSDLFNRQSKILSDNVAKLLSINKVDEVMEKD